MQRIGVLGAAFNPPTLGHDDVIEQALPHFDEILLVPSLSHPFLKPLAPIEHRLAMLKIFALPWENKACAVKVMNIEATIQAAQELFKPIFTFDVLTALTQLYQTYQKPFQIRFILGPDNRQIETWQRFYRYQEIEKYWPLFIAEERLAIHSSMVRETLQRYRQDKALLQAKLTNLVSPAIAQYILDHHLYE